MPDRISDERIDMLASALRGAQSDVYAVVAAIKSQRARADAAERLAEDRRLANEAVRTAHAVTHSILVGVTIGSHDIERIAATFEGPGTGERLVAVEIPVDFGDLGRSRIGLDIPFDALAAFVHAVENARRTA